MSWRLRSSAKGARHRITLGTNHEGWNEQRARERTGPGSWARSSRHLDAPAARARARQVIESAETIT